MTDIERALTSVSKKYVCDDCGEEFQTHRKAVLHASKCTSYNIDQDQTVRRVKA